MSEQREHTPGEWTRNANMIWAPGQGWQGVVVARDVVCYDLHSQTYNCIQAEANAQLISASPELLEACELALRILDRDGIRPLRGEAWLDGEREKIKAAIDKATLRRIVVVDDPA